MYSNKEDRRSSSILLPALPALRGLESAKQDGIFQMLGVKKTVANRIAKESERLGIQIDRRGKGTPRHGEYDEFLRRILLIDTQKTRQRAMDTIEDLIRKALAHGAKKDLSEYERINWFRTVAYLFQVYTKLLHEYDANQITAELEDLKKLVHDELEKET